MEKPLSELPLSMSFLITLTNQNKSIYKALSKGMNQKMEKEGLPHLVLNVKARISGFSFSFFFFWLAMSKNNAWCIAPLWVAIDGNQTSAQHLSAFRRNRWRGSAEIAENLSVAGIILELSWKYLGIRERMRRKHHFWIVHVRHKYFKICTVYGDNKFLVSKSWNVA